MPLNAGELNRKATVERYTAVANGQGGDAWTWVPLRDVPVKASPIAGKEALINGTLRSSQGWRIEMRFASGRDLTVKDRLRAAWLIGNQVMGIQSVADPDGRRESLVLFCETESGVV